MNPEHLRKHVIRPTLELMGEKFTGAAAENLLLGTCAQESLMGEYLVQLGGGRALGIYQMEPFTHASLWDNRIRYRLGDYGRWLDALLPHYKKSKSFYPPDHRWLVWNLAYATAMARLKYYGDPEALPQAHDIEGLAAMWKRVYNTPDGKGTVEEFVEHYNELVRGR